MEQLWLLSTGTGGRTSRYASIPNMRFIRTLIAITIALFALAPATRAQLLDGNYEIRHTDGTPLLAGHYAGVFVTPCAPSWGDVYLVNELTGENTEIYTVYYEFVEPGIYHWTVSTTGATGLLIHMGPFWYSLHGTNPAKDRIVIPD